VQLVGGGEHVIDSDRAVSIARDVAEKNMAATAPTGTGGW